MAGILSIIGKRLCGSRFNLWRDKWLVGYTFLAIFQPPFIPVAFIYILGLFTLAWLYYNGRNALSRSILVQSKIYSMIKLFAVVILYLIVVGLLDMMLIETANVNSTRMTSMNQVSLLTLLEFCFAWTILICCHRRQYSLTDIFLLLIFAGILQGLCAVVAFLVPPVRTVFLMFCDANLYAKEYFLLRRGYGFSINLIDTFGYGMGLIASYMLIIKWTRSKILLIVSVLTVLFAILVNARTGIAVFGIGVIINFLLRRNIWRSLGRILIIFLVFEISVPILISGANALVKSKNETVSWVAMGMKQMLLLVGGDKDAPEVGVEDVSFFDNFIEPPADTFRYLLGSGHHVYDTQQTMGFRTDIGYLNLLWEFGVVGSGLVLLCMAVFMIGPFFMTKDLVIRKIALLNTVAYGVVLMKAILIGFNPGVFVNYLATFSLYYIINKKRIGVRKPRYVIEKRDSDVSAPVVDSNSGL